MIAKVSLAKVSQCWGEWGGGRRVGEGWEVGLRVVLLSLLRFSF